MPCNWCTGRTSVGAALTRTVRPLRAEVKVGNEVQAGLQYCDILQRSRGTNAWKGSS